MSGADGERGGHSGAANEGAPNEETHGPSGRPWLVVALGCVAASAACWWRGLGDAAFVAAALGVVCYFLNQRGKYRRIRDEHEHAQRQANAEQSDPDESE